MSNKQMYSPVNRFTVTYPTLNEPEFYEMYLTLNNLSKPKEEKLSAKAIKLLAAYMAKPLDFLFNFRKKATNNHKSSPIKLGEELGLSKTYTWYLMKELRTKEALIVDEDKVVRPNAELTELRQGTKKVLEKCVVMQFEYVFQAKVVEDDEFNESNLPTSS